MSVFSNKGYIWGIHFLLNVLQFKLIMVWYKIYYNFFLYIPLVRIAEYRKVVNPQLCSPKNSSLIKLSINH